ncbi:CD99 antigen-like protein 2 isoform X2 [Xiphophorus maculatus]|uniref:CD99 antigen-like protein 2 isoform X2 n=1 Tax=Xiphophorus maculatus TaxID=8083 RepID=UPI000C6DEBC2|nr:CD99 antigen-like protein 2 isoform X2 [Xiphophorus maculatus]
MNFCLRILSLLLLIAATLTQDEFDLLDALGPDPTPEKPKEQPGSPKKSGSDGGLDLSDAFGPDPTPAPKKPSSGNSGGFDLEDAVKPGPTKKPKKPGYKPSGGGGGSFDDSDLMDVSNDGYKPDDGGRSGGRAVDPGYDDQGGAGKPQDPDLLWGQILKMLNANMPEEFFMWMSNLMKVLNPLLERAMELLRNLP